MADLPCAVILLATLTLYNREVYCPMVPYVPFESILSTYFSINRFTYESFYATNTFILE